MSLLYFCVDTDFFGDFITFDLRFGQVLDPGDDNVYYRAHED